jgi:hypothetical protein
MEIEEVAERSQELAREAKEVHVVFNNNAEDFASRACGRRWAERVAKQLRRRRQT